MPSFSDSIFIFFLALLLFGPKKLPELARYVGKLMGEFRRASSEFRLQMEDEFRQIEQAEQQKKIAAIEAAAPVAPLNIPEPEHPHTPPPMVSEEEALASFTENHIDSRPPEPVEAAEERPAPLPIASNGDLHLMPPATGLPVARNGGSSASSSLSGVFDAIPQAPEPVGVAANGGAEPEASNHA
jgi:sec-independent protein translocase protein TatB